jgi:hypothetical protein
MSKIPSALCNALNQDKASPFFSLIRRTTTPQNQRAKAVVSDGSLIKVLKESLTQPSGCLFPYRNSMTGETDMDKIWQTTLVYWTAVKNTFPEAWGKDPKKSRLMHSAGLWAMGRLMDRIMSHINPSSKTALVNVRHELELIKPHCHWTSGTWEELGLEWNEIQNVNRHVRALSNHLIRTYLDARS